MESTEKERRNYLVLQRILKDLPWLWAICKFWYSQKIKIRDATTNDLEQIMWGSEYSLGHHSAYLKFEIWSNDTLFSQGVHDLIPTYAAPAKLEYFISFFPIIFRQFDSGPNLTLKKTHVVLMTGQGYLILRPPKSQDSF